MKHLWQCLSQVINLARQIRWGPSSCKVRSQWYQNVILQMSCMMFVQVCNSRLDVAVCACTGAVPTELVTGQWVCVHNDVPRGRRLWETTSLTTTADTEDIYQNMGLWVSSLCGKLKRGCKCRFTRTHMVLTQSLRSWKVYEFIL